MTNITHNISEEDLQDPTFREHLKKQLEVELCSRSYAEFVKKAWSVIDTTELEWNWHMQAICDHLQLVTEGKIRKLLINIPPGMGKALDINTDIPTPNGYKKLRDIMPGDMVYDSNGTPTEVTHVTNIEEKQKCYRVRFQDGSYLDADAEHQWTVFDMKDIRNRKKKYKPSVKTTEQILNSGLCVDNRNRFRIPITKPIKGLKKKYTIPPYVLGIWLGDGNKNNGTITVQEKDKEIIEKCSSQLKKKYGDIHTRVVRDKRNPKVLNAFFGCSKKRKRFKTNLLTTLLDIEDLKSNKHIPEKYLFGSTEDRISLLKGLMDSDGTASRQGNQVSFSNSDPVLAKQVCELARGLGFRATINERIPKYRYNGEKKQGKKTYRVRFSPDICVFSLSRKRKLQTSHSNACHEKMTYKSIVNITPIKPKRMKCIAVQSKTKNYIAGKSFTVTHNTNLCSTFWLAFDWIHNPTRWTIFSTYEQSLSDTHAKKHRDLIQSDWFQERWGSNTPCGIYIKHDDTNKRREFQTVKKGGRISTSVGGKVTGLHADILMFDDLSKAQDAQGKTAIRGDAIKKSVDFWTNTMITRTKKPKEVVCIGVCQRLHHADIAQYCIDEGDWVHLNLPMEAVPDERTITIELPDGSFVSCQGDDEAKPYLDEGGEIFFEDSREKGELLFPARADEKVVEDLKKSLTSNAAAAQLQQKPTPDEGASIKLEWFNYYKLSELKQTLIDGKGTMLISVDTTSTSKDTSDWVVCQLWKSYQPPKKGPRVPQRLYYLLDQKRLKTGYLGTIEAILSLHQKWAGPKKAIIEESANGYAVLETFNKELAATQGLNFAGFKARASKEERVDSIAHLIENGRVFIPEDGSFDLNDLETEIKHFPYGKHDDQVDALSQALSYFYQHSGESVAKKLKALNRHYGI